MNRLDYKPDYYYSIQAPDGASVLKSYWTSPNSISGVKYEELVHSNIDKDPDTLTHENIDNVALLLPQSYRKPQPPECSEVIERSRKLKEIPRTADVLADTKQYDKHAAELFADLCMVPGVKQVRASGSTHLS
jgi:hypothetical protein